MVFEVAIRIIGRRSRDQVRNFNSIGLRHALDYIVKLSLAGGDSLQTKLGLGLHSHVWMLSGQKGVSLTATALGRSFAKKAVGTPSRTTGSSGMMRAEKKHCQAQNLLTYLSKGTE